jgi:hypothetical protein
LNLAERVREDAGDVAVGLPHQQLLLNEDWLTIYVRCTLGVATGQVGDLLDDSPPVEPPTQILISDLRRDILEAAVDLESGGKIVVPQHITEVQRCTAPDEGSK